MVRQSAGEKEVLKEQEEELCRLLKRSPGLCVPHSERIEVHLQNPCGEMSSPVIQVHHTGHGIYAFRGMELGGV
jgi:hypothetical protein